MLLQFFQFSVLALTASASCPHLIHLQSSAIHASICPSFFFFARLVFPCFHSVLVHYFVHIGFMRFQCKYGTKWIRFFAKKKKKVLDAESGAQVISTLLIYQMEKQTIYHAANGCLCVDGCQLSCRGNSCKSLSIIGQTLSPISLKHICKSRYSYTVIHTRTSAGMDDFPA